MSTQHELPQSEVELKFVQDLCGMKFFIPSYQRGYRWTEQQVTDLLDDLADFKPLKIDGEEETWYCLQPLVVCQRSDNSYEVIDGQQRLTTIALIMETFCEFDYENRTDSEIDQYFKDRAIEAIENWRKRNEERWEVMKNNLTYHCKVIWYESEDNPYEVFRRLNSGKISLSNAELVKALFLADSNPTPESTRRQLEMAAEWDRMEQILHEESFWYFINPNPLDEAYDATRMDFVLEMVLCCHGIENLDDGKRQNSYFVFAEFNRFIKKDKDEWWNKVVDMFRYMKSWYDDRELYHYVGYLVNRKGTEKTNLLTVIYQQAKEKTKTNFLQELKKLCQKTLPFKSKKCQLETLEYGKDNDKIYNVLLLFNIATTQMQVSEQSRYPFNLNYQVASWSLEHIHAQNERRANWKPKEVDQLKAQLATITTKENGIKEFCEYLTSETIKEEETYRTLINLFMGASIKEAKSSEEDENKKVFSCDFDFEKDDHLTNLALLQQEKNSSLNNKLYPEKRAKIAVWESLEGEEGNKEKEDGKPQFLPICTRNVFFKHYSPDSSNPFIWDRQAGIDYVKAMVRTVASFIDVEADFSEDNNKYGFKLKEDKQ